MGKKGPSRSCSHAMNEVVLEVCSLSCLQYVVCLLKLCHLIANYRDNVIHLFLHYWIRQAGHINIDNTWFIMQRYLLYWDFLITMIRGSFSGLMDWIKFLWYEFCLLWNLLTCTYPSLCVCVASRFSVLSDSWFWQYWFEEYASWEFKICCSSNLALIVEFCSSQIPQSSLENCKTTYIKACFLNWIWITCNSRHSQCFTSFGSTKKRISIKYRLQITGVLLLETF